MKRAIHFQNNGWNWRVKMLADSNECTSDDERDASGDLHIFAKRARNPHVTDFYRAMDKQRVDGIPALRGQRRRRPDRRIPHPLNNQSEISQRLPEYCPLDWFDPDYFNSLDISIRMLYIGCPIALPLAADVTASPSGWDWKAMEEKEFMKKYGNKVRELYNIPTREEIAAMNARDEGEDL